MEINPRKKISFWRGFLIGGLNGLLILLLWGLVSGMMPMVKSEFFYWLKNRFQLCPCSPQVSRESELDSFLLSLNPPDFDFSLVIPKIDARAKIIANVDAANPQEYQQALLKGVAHAKGTVFPGMKGTIFLFAHSANTPWEIAHYNAVFYLLRELEPGDLIALYFQGKGFAYQVERKEIVAPTETSFFKQRERELLVLQTCYPPGTTSKALLIYARPAGGGFGDLINLRPK